MKKGGRRCRRPPCFTRKRSLFGIRFLHVGRDSDDAVVSAAAYRERRRDGVTVQVAVCRGNEGARGRVGARGSVAVLVVLRLVHRELEATPAGRGTRAPVRRLRLILLACGHAARDRCRASAERTHERGERARGNKSAIALLTLDGGRGVFRDLTERVAR